ncbi:MAG: SOS response-associated peptidase [Steroidobacteraceae bacterium]
MCERYVLPDQITAEREFLPARAWWSFAAKFNVAAQQYVPSIRWHSGESEAAMMRWGLVPSWAEGKWIDEPPACVDIAEALDSPAFRGPWLNSQRCILPIAGFYVWELTNAKYRQPHFVRVLDRAVIGLAAVWDRSVAGDDDVIESCAVVRVPANTLLMELGSTRMPAIIRRKDYRIWLQGTPVEAKATLHSYDPKRMHAYAVSPRINSTVPEGPELIRQVS